MRWPISAVLSNEQVTIGYLDLKSEQWALAEDLMKVLRPFEVATTFLSYEENSSISVLLPVLFSLVENLRDSSDDSPTIAQFKRKVSSEITRRWELESLDTSSCMVLSAVLDPRFRPPKCSSVSNKLKL